MSRVAGEVESPWRRIFEEVRGALGGRRDASGVVGSINWLRTQMALRGANPNVVRNIIYRDKGKVADKRVLFTVLSELWASTGRPPLHAPELELLLSAPPEGEHEALQLLGREKRRVYGGFVGAVRAGKGPKLLLTGRQGSGKTLLTDYVQGALEGLPEAENGSRVVRQEFSAADLAAGLLQLALAVGVSAEVFGAKLAKVGVAGAYAVQADAQADVVRVVLEQLRQLSEPPILLLHVSQSFSGTQDTLSGAPLRLSTPDVPRVALTEWLWHTLLEPLGRTQLGLLVSMADLPLTLVGRTGAFEGPVKLSPPTINEARRFVRGRAQHLSAEQQEALVGRAKRSFEDLRTLTLLAEAREPLGEGRHTEQLGRLVLSSSDARLKDFLEVLAVLALPEYPAVLQRDLEALREAEPRTLNGLELSFLDAVPGEPDLWRPFARLFSRTLRRLFKEANPARFRKLSLEASRLYADAARQAPRSDAAGRFFHHLFAARAWPELTSWAEAATIPQSLLGRLWGAAQDELAPHDTPTFELVALQVANYYVRLGSTDHPDAGQALAVLGASADPKRRAWALLKRAESAVLQGRFGHAETLLESWTEVDDPVLSVEAALVHANLARWHSRLSDAAALARTGLNALPGALPGSALTRSPPLTPTLAVRVALWDGLTAKDQGDLEGALERFRAIQTDDELLRARVHFQAGGVSLQLGRFAEAHAALSGAVDAAYRGEAPVAERARYLSRRGTLRRRQGAFEAAGADFAAARTVLDQAELGADSFRLHFERAKIHDEETLNYLAEGRFSAAITTLQKNIEAFNRYGEHYGVDPSFRTLRSTLRLTLAYGCRALNRPYRLPLGLYSEAAAAHPDLGWARRLVREVLTTLENAPGRYGNLRTAAHLVGSLLLPPGEATVEAERALALARYPYQQSRAQAYLAGALVRRGEFGRASELLTHARTQLRAADTDDTASWAYLTVLEACTLLCSGKMQEAHARVAEGLTEPRLQPLHDLLVRRFGEAAEHLGVPVDAATLGLGGPLPSTLRPADALVLRLERRDVLVQEGAQDGVQDGSSREDSGATAELTIPGAQMEQAG